MNKLIYAILILMLFIAFKIAVKVINRAIDKHRIQESKKINMQCDATECRANRIGQDIIEAMEDVENTAWLSDEEKASFLQRYQTILDDVIATKSDVEKIRKQFSMEGVVKNV